MYKRDDKPIVVEPRHLILGGIFQKIKNQTYSEESNKNVHLWGKGVKIKGFEIFKPEKRKGVYAHCLQILEWLS